ncbi:MAG TPA: OsmC family protein [Candidatus Hydrogenedentes bacterium]|jgi:osmotically inducible protein OsmC|nr:OsmC family protein [Candidatus Hydrogenedentota bacterium]NLT59189.1 OsmC family protein [Candidatus Hydrogenedentota bacterium]HNZ17016.1 OsmC family protein [Candidatus Hydrogenedentota bacterium]HOH32704.1 OsmC family protein [Candidatus Hydrogenedentota bacterium]HPA05494.1 OsmC family protein [Candidatus Hydrogenedentota bacterium]
MPTRKAEARWEGSLIKGTGTMKLGSGAYEGPFSFGTRFQDAPGTNPEELIGAAHAGCFSMAFSALLGDAGFTPERIDTTAKVTIDKVEGGFAITRIDLDMTARIPEISASRFAEIANQAKEGCPVSKALAGTRIELNATLL